jgi:hypothetical protein
VTPVYYVLTPHERSVEVGDLVATLHGYVRIRAPLSGGRWIVTREEGPPRDWRPIGRHTIKALEL